MRLKVKVYYDTKREFPFPLVLYLAQTKAGFILFLKTRCSFLPKSPRSVVYSDQRRGLGFDTEHVGW